MVFFCYRKCLQSYFLKIALILATVFFLTTLSPFCISSKILSAGLPKDKELWWISPGFEKNKPLTIAIMPMDNFSLEPDVENILFNEVYEQLSQKGYMRISTDVVKEAMEKLGIQMAGQINAFSSKRLADELKCDAVLMGRIDQSAHINQGLYDAVVVSCSLWLKDLTTGNILWRAEQWRTAHRQWQMDPFNALLNYYQHENTSRKDRIEYLVFSMLSTLPRGRVKLMETNLFQQAKPIQAEELNDE